MISPKDERKVFVYGSLRNGFFNYDKYLTNKVEESYLGKVKGKLYHMPHKGYPALLDGEDDVTGEIMSLKDFHKDIIPIDEMEGYFGQNSSKNEYNRVIMDVENLETNSIEQCYVYKYALNDKAEFTQHSIYISHGDWKQHMNNN